MAGSGSPRSQTAGRREGWSRGGSGGDLCHWIPITGLDCVAQQGGARLCAGKIAGTDVRNPIGGSLGLPGAIGSGAITWGNLTAIWYCCAQWHPNGEAEL